MGKGQWIQGRGNYWQSILELPIAVHIRTIPLAPRTAAVTYYLVDSMLKQAWQLCKHAMGTDEQAQHQQQEQM